MARTPSSWFMNMRARVKFTLILVAPSCCALLSFLVGPVEEIQSLSKAELCLAAHRAHPLCLSGLSHRCRHDTLQHRAIRRLSSVTPFDLTIPARAAHGCMAVLH